MADRTGKLIIMRKHFRRENGKRAKRKFYEPNELDALKDLAQSFTDGQDEDFIIVQVVHEATRPPSGKKDGGGRSVGMVAE